MKFSMKVVGDVNVLKNINTQANVKISKNIRKAINLTRLKVENSARRLAPKDTGALKASIWSEMVNDETAKVADGVFYGLFQEVGTEKFSAQPFLRPALEMHKKDLEKELKKIIK